MNNRTQPALRLVVDNTIPDPERERREQMAAELIAFPNAPGVASWRRSTDHRGAESGHPLRQGGKWKDAADDAPFSASRCWAKSL